MARTNPLTMANASNRAPARAAPWAASLAWTALLLAVFVPLATARYARPA